MLDRVVDRKWSGLVVGVLALSVAACTGDAAGDGGAPTGSAESSAGPRVQQEPPQDYAIDECLVGVWTTVSQRDETTLNGEPVVILDIERQLRFAADGEEVVTFLDTPAAVQTPSGESIGTATHAGELSYQVNTDEPGTLSFQATGGSATATFDIRGQSSTFTVGGSAPVAYTCSPAELTQNADGYAAVFTRAT